MIKKKKFDHFFTDKEIIFYNDKYDLSEKMNFYKKNIKERKKIARKGQEKYFELFNEIEVAKYIVNKSFDFKNFTPAWHKYIR